MSNRWFRFVLALLALAAASAAGYRIFQHEQQLESSRASSRAARHAADSALVTLSEIQAALHAYVAPGQSHDFWSSQVDLLLNSLRASILELDTLASAREKAVTEALDHSDRFAASEERARRYGQAGQSLLAGEVIFTEAADELDAMREQVIRVRDELAQFDDQQQATLRREQTLLVLGAAGVLALAVLVLVPPGRSASVAPHTSVAPHAPAHRTASASARGQSQASYGETSPKRPGGREGGPVAPVSLVDAAAVCTDFGRVSQSIEISGLLARAADVLSASGVIVWIASENRDELHAAGSFGYDDRLFAQVGSIRRDEANLTAAAFRDGAPRTTSATRSSSAALAAPLMTPQGPIGVLAAELRELSQVDSDRLAIAAIFAAQLANLLGSMGSAAETIDEHQPHAQNA